MGIEFIKSLQAIQSPMLDVWFSFFTTLGDGSFIVPAIVAGFFLDTEKGFKLAIVCGATLGLNLLLKHLFQVDRPYVVHPEVFRYEESGSSFPSGHAMIGAAFWSYCVSEIVHVRLKNLSVICAACFDTAVTLMGALIVSQIMISRCYFGVHYGVDVIVGGVVGILMTLFFRLCFKRKQRHLTLLKEKK